MKRVKHLLSTDWNKSAVDILREELENLDKDQTATFFESVATLMANQVRELITKSVNAFVEFFRRFRKPNNEYPTPKEIMTREFDPDTPLEDNFIILTLNVNNTNQIIFTDPIGEVRDQLLNLVNEIIKQSEYLPRPENTIARSEKLHLWHVLDDDDLVRNAKNEIQEILEQNMGIVEKALHVYDDYLFILKERQRVDAFLADSKGYSREDFAAEIAKYQNTWNKIADTMPKELRMNMFMIDCTELNKRLCLECEQLIDRILNRAMEFVLNDTARQIHSLIKNVGERFAQSSKESTAILVSAEKEFEDFKLFKRQELINQYNDLIEWLCFLYNNPRLKILEEHVKSVKQAHDQILKINQYIEAKEKSLRSDREEVVNRLHTKKKVFTESLEKIKVELDKFRENNTKRLEDEYNKTIKMMNDELRNLNDEMQEINQMEIDLDDPPTEYPEIDKYKVDIKPFEELWSIVKIQTAKLAQWQEGPLLQLDPEEVEKDHKTIRPSIRLP